MNMKDLPSSFVFYQAFFEDLTLVKNDYVCFNPFSEKELSLPYELSYKILISYKFVKKDVDDFVIDLYHPSGNKMSTIELGKNILESFENNGAELGDDEISIDTISYTAFDNEFEEPGLYSFVARLGDKILNTSYLSIVDSEGAENDE